MSARNNNFKIGLFVLAAVGLLLVGLLAFGARSYLTEKLRLETCVVGDVQGLSVGSQVVLRGVPIGFVKSIGFTWTRYPKSQKRYVVVDFEVENEIAPRQDHETMSARLQREIAQGLRAVVKGQGITGTSIISLEYLGPDANPAPEIDFTPRYDYIPSARSQFTKMIDSIEASLGNIQKLDFAQINQGVTNALVGADRLLAELQAARLPVVSSNANSLIADLKTTTVKLQAAIDQVREAIGEMQLEALGKNADGLVTGLRSTNVKLQSVLDRLGETQLPETVSDIRQAVETLNGVLLELKQYPSGFLLGQPPPPAKAVQPQRK